MSTTYTEKKKKNEMKITHLFVPENPSFEVDAEHSAAHNRMAALLDDGMEAPPLLVFDVPVGFDS